MLESFWAICSVDPSPLTHSPWFERWKLFHSLPLLHSLCKDDNAIFKFKSGKLHIQLLRLRLSFPTQFTLSVEDVTMKWMGREEKKAKRVFWSMPKLTLVHHPWAHYLSSWQNETKVFTWISNFSEKGFECADGSLAWVVWSESSSEAE